MNVLYRDLRPLGFQTVWFRKPDFPNSHPDAMTSCLVAAGQAHRLILVIDERAGLHHKPSGCTISEAEYRAARTREVPCLVFVRDRVWHQSRVFHRHYTKACKEGVNIDEQWFCELMLDGEMEVYMIIERLQHERANGESNVVWISPFSLADEIVEAVRGKWLLSDSEQLASVAALATAAADRSSPHERDQLASLTRDLGRSASLGKVRIARAAHEQMARLSAKEREALLERLRSLGAAALDGGKNPLELYNASGDQSIVVMRVGPLRVTLCRGPEDTVTILSVLAKRAA